MSINDPREGDFTLRLRPVADPIPVNARLRRLLKCLWRAYGFRLIEITEVPPAAKPEESAPKPPAA